MQVSIALRSESVCHRTREASPGGDMSYNLSWLGFMMAEDSEDRDAGANFTRGANTLGQSIDPQAGANGHAIVI